jgi:hypothetical protein
MNSNGQTLCVWSGILSIVLFFVGFWPLAGFLPPIPPSWDAEHVAAFYRSGSLGVRFGSILMLFSGSLLVPFYAVVSVQLKRIEGTFAPMSYTQMLSGLFALVPFILSTVLWCVAAFRPDRSDAEILMLSDLAWISILMVAPPAIVQFFAIGIAILTDRNVRPVLPRWLAFFTVWCAILGIPSIIIVFFKTGPFAWNGLFGFYLPATLFGVWTIVMALELFKAIKRQESDR